jgi:predicted nucleotidyltransferase
MKEIAARHGAGNPELFGSAARGELRPDSHVDVLPDIVGQTPV